MQWRMEIGYFSNFPIKHLKVIKANALTLISIHYFKSFLTSFLLFCFYYTVMKFIMMFFSTPIYTFCETRVLFNDISFIIRHYFSYIFSIFIVYLLYHIRLIDLSGDIELNPGPKPSSFKHFSICHWNLNRITSHDFLKVKLLTAYSVMYKFDIICISESYFNSDTSSNDNNLNIPSYNMSRADHPFGNQCGGVCIYYKESLPIKMLNINYLQECICLDLKIGRKLCTIVLLYRSPSQSADEFDNSLNKLNLTMESITQKNPFLTAVIDDFNANSSKWWIDDKTSQEGLKIENLLSQISLSQVINEPTHISQNFNSCIDLRFTNQ